MKTKTKFLCAAMSLVVLFISTATIAQQRKYAGPASERSLALRNGGAEGVYSYRLFTLPDKSFDYVIVKNDKVIFHRPAFSKSTNNDNEILAKKEQADIAAKMSIQKIKKGLRPDLTKEELIKITSP